MRKWTGLFLLIYLALAGYLLITVPPWIVARMREVREMGGGPFWVGLYLTLLIAGLLLLAVVTGWTGWELWRRTRTKRQRQTRAARNPSELSAEQRQDEFIDNLAAAARLRDDEAVTPELRRELETAIRQVESKQEEQSLEIVAFGTISSGKSALLNALAGREVFRSDAKGGTTVQRNEIPWPGIDHVRLVDTPGLGEIDGRQHQQVAAEAAQEADVVLLVVDGPLRDSEFRLVKILSEMEKRLLVCLNKADWYESDEQQSLRGQLQRQLADIVAPDDIVLVRAEPVPRTRVRLTAAGESVEEQVLEPPQIEPLAQRMLEVVRRDGTDLLMANLLLQSRGLVESARERVREALDARAWQVVDKYMWGAGGAAALSPLPVVDLAAGSAITAKMVVDLARVYHQQIDLDGAVRLLGQLGKNLVGILGVSAATPAITAAVASMLKTVPGVGTITGGVLQGLVQALITRWIGAVFIQYYRHDMQLTGKSLAETARREWSQLTSVRALTGFLRDARSRLGESVDENPTHAR